MPKQPAPSNKKKGKSSLDDQPTIKGGLARLGLLYPSPGSLICSASTVTKMPSEQIWNVWSRLEKWPMWSKLVTSAKWTKKHSFEVGAEFEMVQNYGFPFMSKKAFPETVRECNPPQSASWWKDHNGVKSCQIWFFEPLPDGGTRVTFTAVYFGLPLTLFKWALKAKLNKAIDESVKALIRLSEKEPLPKAGTAANPVSS